MHGYKADITKDSLVGEWSVVYYFNLEYDLLVYWQKIFHLHNKLLPYHAQFGISRNTAKINRSS